MTSQDDPGLQALITKVTEGNGEPCEEAQELLRDGMPGPVASFLSAVADNGIYVDLAGSAGGFELMAPEALEDHNEAEEIAAALGSQHGIEAENVVVLGSTGGGEESLLMGWTDEGYQVFRWDMDEGSLAANGTFSSFFVRLRDYLAEERECGRADLEGTDLESFLVAIGRWDEAWDG